MPARGEERTMCAESRRLGVGQSATTQPIYESVGQSANLGLGNNVDMDSRRCTSALCLQ